MKGSVKLILVGIAVIIILACIVVYSFARKNFVKVPGNGSDVPSNWDATPEAIKLYNAMKGIGTNEDVFFSTLSALSLGQRALVYNKYLEMYGHSIIEDIQDDFEGNDLTKALDYFKGIPGISLRWAVLKAARNIVS